ncbi:hypothetical protein AYJ54_13535 [Bradyrhizobium centrolobii]|uniref:ATP-grasp domain-containing protein n=1 Tax=Bradyrhizobium centrolobii TaxID=1505087 RepID=A0A176YS79_9BRAD|nr:ATP-grasp domain-containing protein [Bradyrhizobium centrolobii]OAF09283.1 hypothetical protein AYJ54_13535 [Bradyrhizobium centrolobii]
MTGALVIGGDYRGLGIVRSLGRHGIPVWVAAERFSLARASRYATGRTVWPAALEEQLTCLIDLADRHGLRGWVLFPSGEETASLVAQHADKLAECYKLTTSPWELHRFAADKRLTYGRAEALGIGCAATHYPSTLEELEELKLSYPVILKPARKPIASAFTDAKAWRVDNRQQLLDLYRAASAQIDPDLIMVQELLPGGGEARLSFAALVSDGRPLASVAARRTRQFPADFGRASTFVETIEDLDVVAAAEMLLRDLRLSGPVEVEFQRDPRDGQLKLLDVNPRIWGWHSLGHAAGVDFPYLAWLLAMGKPVPEGRGKPGCRWVRLSTDVPTSVAEIAAGRLALRPYLRSLKPHVEGPIAAWDDPLPIAAELWLIASRLGGLALGGKGEVA